jgi:UPF0755 protein
MSALKNTQDRLLKTRFWSGLSLLLLAVLLGATVCAWWVLRPLPLTASRVDLSIEPGQSVKTIANQTVMSGVDVSPSLLYYFFKFSGQSRYIRAGSYEISQSTSAWQLLNKLVRGEENLKSLTLVEGWNWRQLRQAMDKSDYLKHDTVSLSDEEIMSHLGKKGIAPEGRFYPDTYNFGKGSSDLDVLRRAAKSMDKHLEYAWNNRDLALPLKSADEALVLASIVEKETGLASDRRMIASVFHNRLRIQMPLQTDPTVIYGMGASFDGNLRRVDLKTDHPWNTYVHKGLPPTPIAMPGLAALQATLHPATSKALYFVARGNGSSQFSENLADHNAAVDRYQRGQMADKAQ